MKYQNRKNGVICELVRENKKFKTVTLRDEAGRERDYSSASLTKSWKRLDEEVPTEEKENKLVPMPGADKLAELKNEVCGDGTPYAEIGKEIAEQAKQKVKAVKKSKETTNKKKALATSNKLDDVLEVVNKTTQYVCELKRKHDLVIKDASKKTIAVVYIGKKSLTLYFNSDSVKNMLETNEVIVNSSSEKFAYYAKIDISTLTSVLPKLA